MMTCRGGDISAIIESSQEGVQDGEEETQEYRLVLPALKSPDQKVSVWKVIKDAVGKDLSRFCVPVYFNEPISMLQKVSEMMEYEHLLAKASSPEFARLPIMRLLHVSAFAIA
jgi:oxysterol-binding protein 1